MQMLVIKSKQRKKKSSMDMIQLKTIEGVKQHFMLLGWMSSSKEKTIEMKLK